MPSEEHVVLETRRRVAFFGHHSEYHVVVVRGKERADHHPSRWRWEVFSVDTNAVDFLSPVAGWATEVEAEEDAKRVLTKLGVEFRGGA